MDKGYTPAEAKAWLAGYDAGKAYAKKEWVDLTEDEIEDLTSVMFEEPSNEEVIDFALRLLAKVKEKNI